MKIWFIENHQWFFSGAGVALCSALGWAALFLYRTYADGFKGYQDIRKYVGDYAIYYYASTNEAKIARMHFTVKKRWFGGLLIANQDKLYTYKGEIIKRGSLLFMHLPEKSREEFLHYVLHAPLNGRPEMMVGVFSAISNKKDPVAGKVIFVRLASDTAEEDVTLEESEVDPAIVGFLKLKAGSAAHPNHIIVVEEPAYYAKEYLSS